MAKIFFIIRIYVDKTIKVKDKLYLYYIAFVEFMSTYCGATVFSRHHGRSCEEGR